MLFSLLVDPSKADPVAADAYLKKLEESWKAESEEGTIENENLVELVAKLEALFADEQVEEALNGFVAVGDPSVITSDTDGAYRYEYSEENESEIIYFYLDNFQSGWDYMISYTDFNEETNEWMGLCIDLLTKNENGTATDQRYKMAIE